MSEILTSSLTILGGTFVYASSQIASKFLIEPIYEQKRYIGKIADSLIFYANIYTNPNPSSEGLIEKIEKSFRKHSTFLSSKTMMIPMYGFLSCFNIVLPKENIENACSELIGLSNSIRPLLRGEGYNIGLINNGRAEKIKILLKIAR